MNSQSASRHSPFRLSLYLLVIAGAVLSWFALSEVVTESWYRWKESRMPKTEPWEIKWPTDKDAAQRGFFGFKSREMTDREQELLRYETARSASWRDATGNMWTGFHLTWPDDRRLNDTDMAHNPTRCLPAVGLKLDKKLSPVDLQADGQLLTFQGWSFEYRNSKVFAFLANRRDRKPSNITYSKAGSKIVEYLRRLQKVDSGNRSNPVEMLELVVQGPSTEAEAVDVLRRQVPQLISNTP